MRYYDLQIKASSGGNTLSYTSHPGGPSQPPDPGALQVEMDLIVLNASSLTGGTSDINSYVRLWGIPINVISQAQDYNNGTLTIKGGMGKGLPLADPSQSGTLLTGLVNQCFGNWLGTDMTLDLLLSAGGGPKAGPTPRNLTQDWKANTPMSQAIQTTLQTAFPGSKVTVNVSDKLIKNSDQPGYYQSLTQYADYVRQVSAGIVGNSVANYQGVQIAFTPTGEIRVYDQTSKAGNTKEVKFTDLIGQPTWLRPFTIMVTVAMRADIIQGDRITLPQTQIQTTGQAFSAYSGLRQSSIFKGTYQVQKVRHVGNYKQASALGWVTHLECIGPDTAIGG